MRTPTVLLLALASLIPSTARAGGGVHVTWLWHLEQPIYWPAPNAGGGRYQTAWDSIQARSGGAEHPQNDLPTIFGKDDRVAAYQWRPGREAVGAMLGHPEAGAQVSYSGGLIENVRSLGEAGQLGYGAGWADAFREARARTTRGGHPRLDMVMFPFHHALIPLIDDAVLRMELRLYKAVYEEAWGPGEPSRGLFPSEMAFAEHVIPALVDEGIAWVVVSNAHLSRACADYPWVKGSGGDNIPPPNRWDQQNPAQGEYNRISIDRGVSPANAVPFAYQPHHARWVDPATGEESRIVVVPAAQGESWQDGYSCFGVEPVQALAPRSPDDHPVLLLLAHDGDNAFGGGFSYYNECTPRLVADVAGAGHTPTTVAQYLADHPPAADDVVHVESGAWVNADGDFGAPAFWNWNWPLVGPDGAVDIEGGFAEDERNWAVIVAATNVVLTATAVGGEPDPARVLHPDREPRANDVEQAWHYLLGSLNSGYMYYGKALDMELKPVVACNEAVERATRVLGDGDADPVGPTIWLPQRHPDNPGGLNFGPLYGYREVTGASDFLVWTFVSDVSGVDTVSLMVREDADGLDPADDDANQTYAGGAGVGEWQALPMRRRAMPRGNPTGDPELDVSIEPTRIADAWHAEVEGHTEVLLDYYVEARDAHGNVSRSPIQHVWVGEAAAGPGGGCGAGDGVHWTPCRPTPDDAVTIYSPVPGRLHWGVDGWQAPDARWQPPGTEPFGDGKAVQTPFEGPDDDGFHTVVLGPFAGDPPPVGVVDFVVARADGGWDNNGGQDWHIHIRAPGEPPGPEVDAGVPPTPDAGPVDAPDVAAADASHAVEPDAGGDGGSPDPGGDARGGVDAPASGATTDEGCGCAALGRTPWSPLGLRRR